MANCDHEESSSCSSDSFGAQEKRVGGFDANGNGDIDSITPDSVAPVVLKQDSKEDSSPYKKMSFAERSGSGNRSESNDSESSKQYAKSDTKMNATANTSATATATVTLRTSDTDKKLPFSTSSFTTSRAVGNPNEIKSHDNATNTNNNINNTTQTNRNQDQDSKQQQQETFLRTTPGAFAINNPLSPSGDLPLLEHRQSVLVGGSFTSTVLSTIGSQTTSTAIDEETNNSDYKHLQVVDPPESEKEPVTAMVEMARTQYLSAVRIGHESEVYDGEIIREETEEEKVERKQKQKTRKFVASLVFLFIIGIMIIVGVVTSKNQQLRSGGLGESTSGNLEEPQALQKDSTIDRKQLRDYLVSILTTISGPAGGRVFDRASQATSIDRIKALDWMLDDLVAIGSSASGAPSSPYLIPEWKILQRYVLSLLYFSTEGETWDIQCKFLSEIDECEWIDLTPFEWQKRDPVMQTINENIGVTCNNDGRIQGIYLQWNDLSGTIPEELYYFKDSLEELSLSGGSISGTIPSFLSKMTKLESLALNDNCLSGAIPEGLDTNLPVLKRFSVINNGDLYGSLNGFCNSNEYATEGILAVASECPLPLTMGDDDIELVESRDMYEGLECDCCICCDRNNYDCYDPQSGQSWKSYNLNAKVMKTNDGVKSFDRENECRTLANKKWIHDKCPCFISSGTNITEDGLYAFECADCSQEGADFAFMNWFWF